MKSSCERKFVSLKVVSTHETYCSLPVKNIESFSEESTGPVFPASFLWIHAPPLSQCSFQMVFVLLRKVFELIFLRGTMYMNCIKSLWEAKLRRFLSTSVCMIKEKKKLQKANFCLDSNVIFACTTFILISSLTRSVNFPGKLNLSQGRAKTNDLF